MQIADSRNVLSSAVGIREAGEIITLAEGEKGPTRAVRKSVDKIDYGDTSRCHSQLGRNL